MRYPLIQQGGFNVPLGPYHTIILHIIAKIGDCGEWRGLSVSSAAALIISNFARGCRAVLPTFSSPVFYSIHDLAVLTLKKLDTAQGKYPNIYKPAFALHCTRFQHAVRRLGFANVPSGI